MGGYAIEAHAPAAQCRIETIFRRTPGNTAGPVLPHRPSETPPVPQQDQRGVSDVSYGSNLHRKDKPSWAISNVTETQRVPADQIRFACGVCVSWLIGLPRRVGDRLHTIGDAESRWWHWLVTERQGGLTHQYRDARFEAMRRDPSLRAELTT